MKSSKLKFITLIFFIWLFLLLGLVFLNNGLSINFDNAYDWELDNNWWDNKTEFYSPLIKWDSGWYQKIALDGYDDQSLVFLPLYPTLMKIVGNFLNIDVLLAGLIISLLSTILALYYLYKLINDWINNQNSKLALIFFLFFPTSFFLIAVYPESLFLLTVIAAFYYFESDKFLLTAFWLGLASLTKIYGLFLPPIFLIYYLINNRKNINLSALTGLLVSFIPEIFYLTLIDIQYGSWTKIFLSQRNWGRTLWQTNYWQTLLDYLTNLKNLFFAPSLFNFSEATDFIFFLFVIVILVIGYNKIPKLYSIYAALILLLPLASGTLFSFKRYALLIFPIFIILSYYLKDKKTVWSYLTVSIVGLACFWLLFINSYWVG